MNPKETGSSLRHGRGQKATKARRSPGVMKRHLGEKSIHPDGFHVGHVNYVVAELQIPDRTQTAAGHKRMVSTANQTQTFGAPRVPNPNVKGAPRLSPKPVRPISPTSAGQIAHFPSNFFPLHRRTIHLTPVPPPQPGKQHSFLLPSPHIALYVSITSRTACSDAWSNAISSSLRSSSMIRLMPSFPS